MKSSYNLMGFVYYKRFLCGEAPQNHIYKAESRMVTTHFFSISFAQTSFIRYILHTIHAAYLILMLLLVAIYYDVHNTNSTRTVASSVIITQFLGEVCLFEDYCKNAIFLVLRLGFSKKKICIC